MKTISQQTGCTRPGSTMICQDHDALLGITEYSFDLDDQEFIQYFRSRTGLQVGKEDNPALSRFLLTAQGAEKWLFTSPEYCYQNSGKPVPMGKDRENAVKRYKIFKGHLQDCWELYTNSSQPIARPEISNKKKFKNTPVVLTQGDLFKEMCV